MLNNNVIDLKKAEEMFKDEKVDEIIIFSKLRRKNFAKILIFLWKEFMKNNIVYVKDVAKAIRIDPARAYVLLITFANLNLIKKITTDGGLIYFIPSKNDEKMMLEKYLRAAFKIATESE